MKGVDQIKIGISGIRGVVGETLDPEIVINFTRAFATLIRRGRVAVAHGSRPSGAAIKRAVFSGLIFSGITPVDALCLATPSLQVYVREKKLNGGIMITASHNPEEWNGLKFINAEGLFLFPYSALHLIDIYHQGEFLLPRRNSFPAVETEPDAFASHRDRILGLVDVERIRAAKFRVLVDPGGGVGALFDREFLEALGCGVEMIHERVGTRFPRDPEPLPQNLTAASARMRGGEFSVGFAQDSDGDRLCVLDERGMALGGEMSLALALSAFLSQGKRGTIVVNLSTSRLSEHVARRWDCPLQRSAVGEINVVEQMLKSQAIAGGEGNGGIIIPDVHRCRDSFTGMALILDLLARQRKPVSQLAAEFPPYTMISRKLPFSISLAQRVISRLKEEFPEADCRDGIRVDEKEYWFHVRPSNTEPVLRIVAEGPPALVQAVVEKLQNTISRMGS